MAASDIDESTGYRDLAYARSLRGFGAIRALPAAGGWLLEQPIAIAAAGSLSGTPATDYRGGYPLFACGRWSQLAADFESLAQPAGPVAVTAVPDPFGDHDPATLELAFPDHCQPYKLHYGIDLQRWEPPAKRTQHARNAQRALRELTVDVIANPASQLERWCELYENLVDRHRIQGIATFGRNAFADQLALPDLRMLVARAEDVVVGAVLWILDREVATYHLAAYDDVGYANRASFALFQHSIEAFRAGQLSTKVRYLNLGGAAGVGTAPTPTTDGLARFKSGWSNTTRQSLVCGRILDHDAYEKLTQTRESTEFFPAYRAP